MDLLLSLLAFAATMLALATVVTTILELVARLIRRRTRVFAHLLRSVFDAEIRPLLSARLRASHANLNTALERQRREFVKGVMESPLFRHDTRLRQSIAHWLLPNAHSSDELSTQEFVRRLARTEIGQQIHREAAGQLQAMVERIALRYEELCDGAREYFRNSSAVLSLIVGIAIALVYNIDALRVLRYFLDNPQISAAVAADAQKALDDYRAAQARLRSTLEAPGAADSDSRQDVETLKMDAAAARADLEALRARGLPIGLDHFPHCVVWGRTNQADPACAAPVNADWSVKDAFDAGASLVKDQTTAVLLWLVAAVLSGLAIGLGGPFWYDAVTGLARVTQMMRGRASPPEAGTNGAKAQPPSAVDIFVKHVDTRLPVATYAGPRWRPGATGQAGANTGSGG